MSDSSSRITIPPKQWVDLYSLASLPVGTKILIQNTGRDEASLSESEFLPASLVGHNNLLVSSFLVSSDNPVGAWAYSRLGTKIQIEIEGVNGFKPFGASDIAKDFSVNVALGNVPGFSTAAVVMRNPSADNTGFFDVWSGGGDMVLPTSLEVWTIESDSALDVNLTGTGAWTVIVPSLDDGYNIQTPQIINLNGTTPVDLTGTHYRTHQLAATSGALVLTAGSTRTNQGTITIRDKATGNIRVQILPTVSKSEDGHIAVPAGITLLGLAVLNPWGKDESGKFTNFITPSTPNAATIQAGVFPSYQNDLTIIFQAKFKSNQKTDRIFKAKPLNLGAEVTIVEEFYVIDNAIVGI